MSTSPNFLQFEDICKVFRKGLLASPKVALDSVSFGVRSGRCTGLMGHNGAGKTTAIKLLLGLLRPTSGRILFRGRMMRRADRRAVGYMPEVSKLPSEFTCGEVISAQLAFQGAKRRKQDVAHILQQVGLNHRAGDRVGSLSKGMSRRLAWAHATAHDPKVLILDEPFSGLDPASREVMVEMIRQQKERGTSMLISTHELEIALDLCDDLVILQGGRLVLSDSPSDAERAAENVHYELRVSCGNSDDFLAIGQPLGLQHPSSLEQQQFLTIARFDSYPKAVGWLDASLSSGQVVVSFRDVSRMSADTIRPLFSQQEA